MHWHSYARTPQGCAHTFCLALCGFSGDPPMIAHSAHCSSDSGTEPDHHDNDGNRGPGGAPTIQIRQPCRTPGYRGWYDTSPQGILISPWRLTLRKSVKTDVATDQILEFHRQSRSAIYASLRHHHHREARFAQAGWKPRGGDPPGTSPDNRAYGPHPTIGPNSRCLAPLPRHSPTGSIPYKRLR